MTNEYQFLPPGKILPYLQRVPPRLRYNIAYTSKGIPSYEFTVECYNGESPEEMVALGGQLELAIKKQWPLVIPTQ